MSHTPGPWAHRQHTGNESRVIYDASGAYPAPLAMAYRLPDAALIAAAPAMLAALRSALVYLGDHLTDDSQEAAEARRDVLAAIAAATGER